MGHAAFHWWDGARPCQGSCKQQALSSGCSSSQENNGVVCLLSPWNVHLGPGIWVVLQELMLFGAQFCAASSSFSVSLTMELDLCRARGPAIGGLQLATVFLKLHLGNKPCNMRNGTI